MAEVLRRNRRATGWTSVAPVRRSTWLSMRVSCALVGLVALLLAACGTSNGSGPSLAASQTFSWPYFGTDQMQHNAVMDPAMLTAAEDTGTINMLFSGLVTLKPNLTVEPDAATWSVDSTGTIYDFHLKHNLRFSDGTPITASDYAYSIDRALDPNLCGVQDAKSYGPAGAGSCTPGNPNIGDNYLSAILGAGDRISGASSTIIGQGNDQTHGLDVVDPYTLRIRLAHPVQYFLEALTYPTSFPVERSLVQKYPGGLWVDHLNEGGCSGPFKVESYGGGKLLKLVPNTYWEAAWTKLTITEVDRPAFASQDAEYAAYDKAGQFDFTDVPAGQYSLARSQDDFNEVPTLSTSYFGLNFDKAPFDNLLIRRAFDLALNKQILVDRILNGGASPTNHIIPRGMPGFNPNLVNPPPDSTQSLTGNPTAANSLIQQAAQQCKGTTTPPDFCAYIDNGTQSQAISIVYDSNSDTDKNITTAAANTWAQILNLNVKATPSNLPTASFYGNIAPGGSYQAWSLGWIADYPDPQDWTSLQFSHSPVTYNNASDVNDPNLDKLMAKADTDLNTDRMATYNQIEQDLVNLVPWIPYAQGKAIWRQRSWVHGFGLNSLLSMTDVNWPNVYITQH